MKKLILLVMIIILASCSSNSDFVNDNSGEPLLNPDLMEKMENPKLQHKDELFELTLNMDKTTFAKGKPIKISASLTYIGADKSITVWGPRANVVFYITDGNQFNMEGLSTMELMPTTYVKDKKHHFPFTKSGGYSSNDPNASFWKSFYGEKNLLLPEGTYLIGVNCNFSLDETVVNSHYNVSVYTTITVK